MAPRDSARHTRAWRLCVAILESLLRALVPAPVQDLVGRVDRTSIRSLLRRFAVWSQPESTWTINRMTCDPTPFAFDSVSTQRRAFVGSNDKPLSRTPSIAESPMPRTRAEHDETRITDQCDAERNARRDFGGRRAS